MHDGLRILDADAHVIEPGDVFGDGIRSGLEVMDLPETTPREPCGDLSKLADFFADGCSAREYLRCMDVEGIDAVVLYPSMGLYVPYLPELDAKASAAACHAYNEWIASYTATNPSRLAGVGIGLVSGVFAGLAGIGGGVVIVPAGVLFLGLDQHTAQGTSLVAITLTAIAGSVVNLRNNRVRLIDGLWIGVGGAVGALAGARLALGIEGRRLSMIFGMFVLLVALRSLYGAYRPSTV
jgi:hypothetical protein